MSINANHESYDYFDFIVNLLRDDEIGQNTETNTFYEKINTQYNAVYLNNRNRLSPYFKTIYRLMKIIDISQLDEERKQFYSNIVRSQITDSELVLLYYNAHSSHGQNARRHFIKYDLFKHLNSFMKIDFSRYKIPNIQDKAGFIHFLNNLSTMLTQNVKKSRDLESIDPVKLSEKYEKYNIIVCIEIDTELKLEIIYSSYPNFPFEESIFKDFMCHYLFDHFFYSSFIMPSGNEIQKYKTTEDNRNIIGFKIDISNIN